MHLVNILELWIKQKINLSYQDFLSMKNMVKDKRFKQLLKTLPFPYKKITPEEKYLNEKNNPPNVNITFFEDSPNLKNIIVIQMKKISGENLKLNLSSNNQLEILLDGKFTTERGRINCSLREEMANGGG